VTVAPGLLDRRLTLYERQDGGADGFGRPVYVKTGEWWGRLDDTADSQEIPLAPQSHLESRTAAVATVADYVDVPKFGALREGTGPLYLIRGVYLQRALRCQRVTLEAIDPTAYATFTIFEDVEVHDGYHLVTGA
jgi:hypothetical protein